MFDLTYRFDDLPLAQRRDFAGHDWDYAINAAGSATIRVDRDGEWSIYEILIDTTRRTRTPELGLFARGHSYLPATDPLFALIKTALERNCAEDIEDRIADALAEEGISFASADASLRLDAVQLGIGGR